MTDLTEYISHPERLDRNSLFELRGLLARYPYYQTARLLLLKNLYILHDSSFGDELRKAALYVNDRRQLFMLVEGANYIIPKFKSEETSVADGGLSVDRTMSLIDVFLDSLPEEKEERREEKNDTKPVDLATDYVSYLKQLDDIKPEEGEGDANKMQGQSLIDDFINKGDERLMLDIGAPRRKPKHVLPKFSSNADSEDDALAAEDEAVSPSVQDEMPMVAEEPKKKTISFVQSDDDALQNAPEGVNESADDKFFTETLAKIYIKQHRYDKALKIIQQLSLKYPKKNRYFADQIRFLEKLIINSK